MMNYRADVIIPNFNGLHFLEECLTSLAAQDGAEANVVLVDNGSSDGSEEWVRENFPQATVIQMGANFGFGRAVNAGIEMTSSPWVVALNNDTRVEPTWLAALCARAGSDARIGSVASKSVSIHDGKTIDSAGDLCAPYCVGFNRGRGEADEGQYDEPCEVFAACGVAALYRREALAKVGAFDENFFAYYEDIDLGFRLQLGGWTCWYEPAAKVYHHYSGSSEAKMKLGREQVYLHLTGTLIKNMPAALLLKNLPSIAVAHGAMCFAVLQAKRKGQNKLPAVPTLPFLANMLKERRRIQRERVLDPADLEKKFSRKPLGELLRKKREKARE